MKQDISFEKPLRPGRRFLLRLLRGSDILEYLTDFCERKGVRCASVELIGATSVVVIGYYDQKTLQYRRETFAREMEIVSCLGNVSLKEGRPFLHLHAVMGDAKLRCRGGHLFPGSKVFAAEAKIEEMLGAPRVRLHDAVTGLALWSCGPR